MEAHQTSQVFVLRDSSKQNANACSSFFSPSTWFVVILFGEEGRMLNDTLGVVCAVPNEGNQFVFIYFYLLVPWKEGNDHVFGGSRTRGRLQGGRRWEKYNEITVHQSMESTKQQGEMFTNNHCMSTSHP